MRTDLIDQLKSIPNWQARCESHPAHSGIVTHEMIKARMQEEIDDLRSGMQEAIAALEAIESERSAMKHATPKQTTMAQDIANMIEAGSAGPGF